MNIQARCICTTHGKLSLEEIRIKTGIPVCSKCSKELGFGVVKPRKLK